jgi:hypothetical protein
MFLFSSALLNGQNIYGFSISLEKFGESFYAPMILRESVKTVKQPRFSFDLYANLEVGKKAYIPVGVSYSYRSFTFKQNGNLNSLVIHGSYLDIYTGFNIEVVKKGRHRLFTEFNIGFGLPFSSKQDEYYTAVNTLPFTGLYLPYLYTYKNSNKFKNQLTFTPFVELYYNPLYAQNLKTENAFFSYGFKFGLALQPNKK